MKKSLIALAALAAVGVASAQSSVTMYGVADIGYGSHKTSSRDGTVFTKTAGVMDGSNAGSRIGFRGTEDLGGGLRAGFVIEQGISPTNGALFGVRTGNSGIAYDGQAASTSQWDPGTAGGYSQATNRQSYAELGGGFGTVRVGFQYTTLYEVSTLSGFSQTSEGVYGAGISHTWGAGAAGGTRANGITYISPRFAGGFEVSAQVGSAGGRANTEWGSANSGNGLTQDKQNRTSVKLDYTKGPLRAAVAHTSFKSQVSARGDNCNIDNAGTSNDDVCLYNVLGALTLTNGSTTDGPTRFDTKLTQLAASYDFGVAKVGATYNTGSKNTTAVGTPSSGTAPSAGATTAVGQYDFNSLGISAGIPMGAARFVASWGKAELKSSTAVLADYTQMQVGATYALSKRTTAYAYTGNWQNDMATTATAARKGKQAIFGLAHSF